MHIRIPTLFRIWYSSTYTVIFIILLLFLAVTPGDTIYQSIRTGEIQKLFIVGGVYFITFAISALIYSTRLYTNRVVLQSIPKPYIPVEDGEVGKLVRRMIVKALRRSAIIAWDSRPRDLEEEARNEQEAGSRPPTAERDGFTFRRRSHACTTVIPVSAASLPWGHISHPGWASPSTLDFANLQYWRVVTELPNLIEAKAVSLAPPDPAVEDQLGILTETPMLPDAQIVAALQRSHTMGLRDYLSRLASCGLVEPPSLGPMFLAQYEHARFSGQPLTEEEFRELMATFAALLDGMTRLDPDIIEIIRREGEGSDSRSLSVSETSSISTSSGLPYRTPRTYSRTDYFSSNHKVSQAGSPESPETARNAPSMARNSSSGFHTLPRTPSERSRSGSVRQRRVARSPSTILPNSSSSSSLSSDSAQSVIRTSLGTPHDKDT